jgi:predicted GIY-YIG superfamily endonuclease
MWKIYEIRTLDNKVYVGCTSQSIRARISGHKQQNKVFVSQEYSIEIMFETSNRIFAHEFEAYLIKKYNSTDPLNGYNRRF